MAHESSIAESLVRMVDEAARERGAKSVREVNLVVGEATGFMAESLEFYYGVFARELPAKGAKLTVEYVKPTLVCPACKKEFIRRRFSFSCPDCGTDGNPGSKGEEFYIRDLVIET